MTYKLTIQQ